MAIHILPSEVASQIAAGEVIERPASVVKELIENALDAGAKSISIQIEEAGKKLIEVFDDGSGIPGDELSLAVERHATSKLENASDLFQIATLGFRGEALASIGSVSRFSMTSRTPHEEMGYRLQVETGFASPVQTIGAPPGTLVRVENLFFNVPARLKFLKQDTTERRQIDALVTRYALAYPNVRFQLRQENRLALQTSGNGDRREILAVLYGADIARQMLEVISSDREIHIHGYISPTTISRSNRREITFFVNGRPVQDPTLISAFLKGYHTLLMVGRFPLGILFLEMPPEAVDVNVHPTKAEVRFRQSDHVFLGVQNAVRKALLAYNPVANLSSSYSWQSPNNFSPKQEPFSQSWEKTEQIDANFPAQNQQTEPNTTRQPGLPEQRVPLLRPVGQIASAYLVAEGPDGIYLIDQHAAHERILFERFIKQKNASMSAQHLLEPVTVDLPPSHARLISEQLPILEKLGFEVENFGPNTFLIRAIPSLLADIRPEDALRVLVEDFEEDETPFQAEVESRVIARICKRAAVKAGKTLSAEEQRTLVQDLEACQSPRTCPHGRPTMIHLSVDLLERQFGRKGAR
jgi:DNA mismatch repair protein MutL